MILFKKKWRWLIIKNLLFIDKEIEEYLSTKKLNLKAILDKEEAYKNAEFIIIATPTDYDTEKNYFNTKTVETVIEDVIKINPSTWL